ncbi:hypothetical protein LTR84_006316 [Exophiala bonariae]|uniref:Uncharacterized protein n=1 Tax=Exophiala bonariae TaxID=1690606 RepID=A0AAV9N143_9EURO|nr:hypothetical protein LTR84_006316 [Exophiala bonariae]
MENIFSGRTFAVTGGFAGIGLAVVQSLIRLGAKVHAIDIAPSAPAELENHSSVFCTPNGNVSDIAVCKAFVDSIPGDIHGLVNCAGVSPFEDKLASYDLYRQIMEINVTGTWAMATEVIRRMLEQEQLQCAAGCGIFTTAEKSLGQGSIINVSSGGGFRGIPTKAVYCASMTNTTLLNNVAQGEEAREKFINTAKGRIPMGRLAEPTDIADCIVFLLSDAASFITGQVLPVNGGTD